MYSVFVLNFVLLLKALNFQAQIFNSSIKRIFFFLITKKNVSKNLTVSNLMAASFGKVHSPSVQDKKPSGYYLSKSSGVEFKIFNFFFFYQCFSFEVRLKNQCY